MMDSVVDSIGSVMEKEGKDNTRTLSEVLKRFESQPCEIVFAWQDSETEAKGWLVINSLRGGAAGGGTRMREGLTAQEVISLAKTMEIKFTISGPHIGGAKSGIDFDPKDPRKRGVLSRWYKAILPLLKHYYGTGGDLNVDEIHEVIPITKPLGLPHPQAGIVRGHHPGLTAKQEEELFKRLHLGVSAIVRHKAYRPKHSDQHTCADMATGFGVAASVRHFYDLWGGRLKEKRVLVQGWGNVGAASALYLSRWGAKIVGVLDKEHALVHPKGFSLEEVEALFHARKGNALEHPRMRPVKEVEDELWQTPAEIFVPAAASGLLTQAQIRSLHTHNCELIACGANVPFDDKTIFYGPTARYADERMAVIPDFVANCGMARVFAFLMDEQHTLSEEMLFNDISNTIRSAMKDLLMRNPSPKHMIRTALSMALNKLTHISSPPHHEAKQHFLG